MRLLFRKRAEAENRTVDIPGLPDPTGIVSAESAMRIADVYSCVRCLSDAAASVPLHLYRTGELGRERVRTGRAADLLVRPAPATTQANLIGQAVAHLALHGNCFIGKFRDAGGRVEQLALLHPQVVGVELVNGEPRYTLSGPNGRSTHGVADIIHVRGLSTDGLVGLSPIQQCRVAIRVAEGSGLFMDAYLRNGGRPSGVLSIPGVDESFRRHVDQLFHARDAGVRNMHKMVTTNKEMTYTSVAPTLGDMEFIEQRKMSTADICRIFRVPPWMVGATSGDALTYSNTEQQQLAFVTHSLRPWLVLIEQAITNDADVCRGPGLYAEFVLDALLRADHKTRADVYTAALNPQTGWMSRDEVRRAENLPEDGAKQMALSAPEGGA
ncbi:MAG: hypothetical protein QOE25_1572 [Actinomycetota bacterium]|jgi:HK97 family phage portal protein|nr:hypothetical protein [Actinomycetota bacterium]